MVNRWIIGTEELLFHCFLISHILPQEYVQACLMAWYPVVWHGIDDLPPGRVLFRQRRVAAQPHQVGALHRVERVAQLAAVLTDVF